MPTTVQVVIDGACAFAAVVFMYRRTRVMLFPPSALDGHTVAPVQRAEVQRAELVVRRAIRGVRWPAMGLVFVATIVSAHLPSARMAGVVLGGAVLVSATWQTYGMRRWWQWAVRQGADLFLVEELAEEATLVWRHESWWGRRQRRSWMQLPPRTGAL